MKLKLNRIEHLDGDIQSFVFEAQEGLSWKAGQYIKYTLPHENPDDRGIDRWFTVASAPSEREPRITTHIPADNPSSFKKALISLALGDEIEAGAPEGDFTLESMSNKYVFIAGGIGATPFHAILSELDRGVGMPDITFLYGARTNQPTYSTELAELDAKYPNLKLKYIVEPQRVNPAIIQENVADIHTAYFYVSGPEPMVEAFDKMLKDMRIDESKIKKDYFPGYTW